MDIARIRKKAKTRKKKKEISEEVESQVVKKTEDEKPSSEEPSLEAQATEKAVSDLETAEAGTTVEEKKPSDDDEQEPSPKPQLEKVLIFELGSETFAFFMKDIQEIINFYSLTPVPRTSESLAGILSLRGKIIPVLNIKKILNITDIVKRSKAVATAIAEQKRRQKVIIAKGPKGPIGIMTDKIIGVRNINRDGFRESPTHITDEEAKFIEGITIHDQKFITLLKTDTLLQIDIAQK